MNEPNQENNKELRKSQTIVQIEDIRTIDTTVEYTISGQWERTYITKVISVVEVLHSPYILEYRNFIFKDPVYKKIFLISKKVQDAVLNFDSETSIATIELK